MNNRQKFKKTGIKSQERVKKHAEVFTPGWCVRDMIEMIIKNGEAFNKIDETFLEPSCGDGNFIIQILERKIHIVESLFPTKEQYKILTLQCVSSIYGIDIMPDNINECKERVIRCLRKKYIKKYNEKMPVEHENNIRFILDKNIILGNFLTDLTNKNEKIIIRKYDYTDEYVQVSDFYLSDIKENPEHNKPFVVYDKISIKDISNLGGVEV